MARYTIRIKEILELYHFVKENPDKESIIPSIARLDEADRVSNDWSNDFDTNYETPFEKDKFPSVDEIITENWKDLFNFEYPKLTSASEGELEKKILKHYYMREIGFETIERFKLALNETLNRIMPYYNDLAESVLMNKDNPLENYDLIDHSDRKGTTETHSNSEGTTTNTGNSKTIFEDTPSNELSPDTNYATNITKNEGTNTANTNDSGNANGNSTDTYDRHAHGLMGYSKQDMVAKYRENLINIEELIIMELKDLFMSIY